MIVQGSIEWLKLRAGKVTASRVKDIIAKTKSGYSTSRANYRDELVKERFGLMPESFTSDAMAWGTATEPLARSTYEIKNGVMVAERDFIHHPTILNAGMSPDGLVGNNLVEFKCPNSTTMFDYILDGVVVEKYKPQMSWQMACKPDAEWCDFVAYDPRNPKGLDYFQIRYERDNDYIGMLEKEVTEFLKEVDARYNQLNELLTLKKAA